MNKLASFDRTVKARKSSTGRPQMINGWYPSTPSATIQKNQHASSGQPLPKSNKLEIKDWLKATGKNLKGSAEERQEVCRAFICYQRGNVYMSPAERGKDCFQTTAVVIG